jgi:hypothetical protein
MRRPGVSPTQTDQPTQEAPSNLLQNRCVEDFAVHPWSQFLSRIWTFEKAIADKIDFKYIQELAFEGFFFSVCSLFPPFARKSLTL